MGKQMCPERPCENLSVLKKIKYNILTPQREMLHTELCSSTVRYELTPFPFDKNY